MAHLLLLHGALGSKEQFRDLASLLHTDHIIDTISLSGHGHTPSSHHAFTIQNCAHEVLDWLNAHQRQTIDIFGYSMGGYIALWLARFYPDRVGRIFTLGTKLEWNEDIAIKENKLLNADKIQEKVPAFAKELAARHGEYEWRSVLLKTTNLMHDLGKNHLTDEDFKQIRSKVVLGLGDHDTMVSLAETMHVQSLIPHSSYIEMKDTPHPYEKVPLNLLSHEIKKFFKA